ECTQGERYDQVVKIHLCITAGAKGCYFIIQRVSDRPLGLYRANEQEESDTI
ncbi:uncharacterized protein EV154DRAFT_461956, partial [Mucor mucedo]|uniref:uncharacterized protein n=1 Tax=Mucor mucedo TaxID=29922 RepID=UPI00221ED2A7